MAEPYAPGSKEWWLVRQVANGDERRSWYELTDEDRAALVAPAALTALAAMDGAFVTSCSVGNPDPAKRAASVRIEFWGEGSLTRARAAEDALQAALNTALQRSEAGGWQDIESAPRDGTEVLLICASAYSPTASVGWWSDGAGGKGWRHYSRPADKWSGGVHLWFPTHWQPLPALQPETPDRG